jgi:hypothetical protein
MNTLITTIQVYKGKYDENFIFYNEKLKFNPSEKDEFLLMNSDYPGAAIRLVATKKQKQKEDCQLSFFLEKNLPSYCKYLQSMGVEIEVATDRFNSKYVASFSDLSNNLILVHCNNFEDDAGEVFDVLTFD